MSGLTPCVTLSLVLVSFGDETVGASLQQSRHTNMEYKRGLVLILSMLLWTVWIALLRYYWP
jgi:hypothetical protein